uniref:Calponin-homology (CH) domain-containing protein n=1 Tax=Acanthochromis polyacanthus TaxID=80966 RepID=A0A3Q1ETL6_9TELE
MLVIEFVSFTSIKYNTALKCMPATEKDLAEDAPWKKIQQNTFTRWINEHLKCVNKRIVDLQLDLGDGLRLIALLEVLSHKTMYRKYHSRPTFRQMKLENVSVALEFLDKESIKLVSIGDGGNLSHRAGAERC